MTANLNGGVRGGYDFADVRREEVLSAIVELRAQYGFALVPPSVMLAQSDLETGGWTSPLCVDHNNAWGMMMPRQRETTAIGETTADEGAFAVYSSLRSSVEDYLMRQRNFGIPNTSDPIVYAQATVDSNYATGANYLQAWLGRVVEIEENDLAEPAGGGSGPVLVGLLLLAWAAS